jgi:hypothetical protein
VNYYYIINLFYLTAMINIFTYLLIAFLKKCTECYKSFKLFIAKLAFICTYLRLSHLVSA